MNFDYWKGELTVYPKEKFNEDEDEVCMICQNSPQMFSVSVDPDWKIEIEEHEGRQYIALTPKTKANLGGTE